MRHITRQTLGYRSNLATEACTAMDACKTLHIKKKKWNIMVRNIIRSVNLIQCEPCMSKLSLSGTIHQTLNRQLNQIYLFWWTHMHIFVILNLLSHFNVFHLPPVIRTLKLQCGTSSSTFWKWELLHTHCQYSYSL